MSAGTYEIVDWMFSRRGVHFPSYVIIFWDVITYLYIFKD